ncbi:uncharacterized protein [Rutidosis leptorrhynchoides]|uniref:uncharacterized protein n=1 Tax=Rutidosis leptorrhynchoides TaxID=125765 RepID=UPI003A99DF3D
MNCNPPAFKGSEEAGKLVHWFEKLESIFRVCNCGDNDRVKYATSSLAGNAMTWWTAHAKSVGIDNSNTTPWDELKNMMVNKFCPRSQVQKLEAEFRELKVKGTDIESYTNRFLKLSTLCPEIFPTEPRRIERYIEGLPEDVQGNVIAAEKVTLDAVILMAQNLMMAKRRRALASKQVDTKSSDGKRKFEPS